MGRDSDEWRLAQLEEEKIWREEKAFGGDPVPVKPTRPKLKLVKTLADFGGDKKKHLEYLAQLIEQTTKRGTK
jgi:hypothetical protein